MAILSIDEMTPADGEAVLRIYQAGMDTGVATFETQAPDWEEWNARHLPICRLAARLDGKVIGWAALSPVSSRRVYRGVAEVSLYVDADFHRQGVGRALLTRLIELSEQHGFWTLQASIFAVNLASLALHQSCGFRVVGVREKIAQRDGAWRDTLLLERRSRQPQTM